MIISTKNGCKVFYFFYHFLQLITINNVAIKHKMQFYVYK